jgi:hypothetical protein
MSRTSSEIPWPALAEVHDLFVEFLAESANWQGEVEDLLYDVWTTMPESQERPESVPEFSEKQFASLERMLDEDRRARTELHAEISAELRELRELVEQGGKPRRSRRR